MRRTSFASALHHIRPAHHSVLVYRPRRGLHVQPVDPNAGRPQEADLLSERVIVDVHLGDLEVDGEAVPVWMSAAQHEYWKHTHLTIDVVRGRGSGFSLEAPEGVRFLIRSRLLTDDELEAFGLA